MAQHLFSLHFHISALAVNANMLISSYAATRAEDRSMGAHNLDQD